MTDADEQPAVADLHAQIQELTERNRLLTAALRPDSRMTYDGFTLSKQQGVIITALTERQGAVFHSERLSQRLDLTSAFGAHEKSHIGVAIFRLRNVLRPFGIFIKNVWGVGYVMEPASFALLMARRRIR